MIIKLDLEKKTIIIEQDVILKDLFEKLEELFPNKTWEQFKLIQKVENPTIYRNNSPYRNPISSPISHFLES